MELEEFKNKLRTYKKKDIVVTEHADLQAFSRRIDLEEVKENLINPVRLVYFNREEEYSNEERYECFFEYASNLYHKYAVVLKRKIIIVTVIVINRRWQGEIKP
jgi:hypothetical protein